MSSSEPTTAKRDAIPRPSAAELDRAAALLCQRLGPSKVLTEREACVAYGGDESEADPVAPDIVVLASSASDVTTALSLSRERGIPITPRAAGSGKSGGAIPIHGGIVLATLGMNQIEEIDCEEQLAVVGPGVVLGDLHHAVEAEGLFYPPDANSMSWCAVGGNIAENAGGPRAFKYGVTRDYILGMDVATMDGQLLSIGRRTKKGVTGYDLTGLMVGSEGTLGVVTRATVRLIVKPATVATLLVLFDSVLKAGRAVTSIVSCGVTPRCIELLDDAALSAVRGAGVAIDASARAMLLVEVDGEPTETERAMERVGQVCMDAQADNVLVAQDPAKRARLWEARRQLSPVTRAMARHKISEDVVVPRTRVADLLKRVEEISEVTGVRMLTYGHAGDGNMHVNFLWDEPEKRPSVQQGMQLLFESVISMRGTLSGEHGIGLSKSAFLPLEQSTAVITLQQKLKATFDPKGLLNPGKIFPTGHRPC